MKANELRIGNYITAFDLDGDYVEVGFLSTRLETIQGTYYKYSQCNPIPITEEWLKRFGLVSKGIKGIKVFYIRGMQCELNEDRVTCAFYDNEYGAEPDTIIHKYYIHQLQNLYFALTGEELEIKE